MRWDIIFQVGTAVVAVAGTIIGSVALARTCKGDEGEKKEEKKEEKK